MSSTSTNSTNTATASVPPPAPTANLNVPATAPALHTETHNFILYLIIVVVIIVVYYTLFASLGSLEDTAAKSIIEIVLWGSFIVLVLLNGLSYIFQIDVINSLKNLFWSKPIIGATSVPAPDTGVRPVILSPEQVFHVPGNTYSYGDSTAVCKAYGGRLANYMDMDAAFQKGADWCSYGWSDGQMALFPTQQAKWDELQKVEGHEHDCGRPGINGGYISNAQARFGVNCFGKKPAITPSDLTAMQNTPLYLKSQKERQFDQTVDAWKKKVQTISVAPFNHNQWSVL